MSDLGTFHRLLVTQLARTAPARLHAGLAISEIRDSLLPYRRFRAPLGVHMEEDYDALLLQLAAGDHGLAALDDAGLLKLFQAERRSPNPDLLQLDVHGAAKLTLDAAQIERVLAAEATAPPAAPPETGLLLIDVADEERFDDLPLDIARAAIQPQPPSPPAAAEPPPAPEPAPAPAAPSCPFCGDTLPLGRAVRFCPHCGQNQKTMPCPECGAEAEIGWKHCVACGSGLPTF